LLASDGLWRSVSAQKICDVINAQKDDLASAAKQLLAAAQLPSQRLQDDFSVALCICESG
jgi:serine/threonine protein phosphatase PrpC